MAGSTVGDFGWIQTQNFPALINSSTNCLWTLNIPPGHAAQIGFEQFFVEHIFEESELLKKRPRLDDVEEIEEEIYDAFGTFREGRKSDKELGKKFEKNSDSIVLSDAITGETLLRAPLSSIQVKM